jgi:hypothetical protein
VSFYHARPEDEEGFQWVQPKDQHRHLFARAGDNLLTPFQCDLCICRNLTGRNPGPHNQLLMACIRQINLDALWGRETATVTTNLRAVQHTIKALAQVHLTPPFPTLGPFSVEDNMGYRIAVAMVLKSRDPGRYADYQQFETVRKLRSAFSNVYMASPVGVQSLRTVGGDKAKHYLNDCPTHSLWFERFTRGCLSRMGQIVKQDRAVSLELMHALSSLLEEEWGRAASPSDKGLVAGVGAMAIIAFCGSFHGPEMFAIDLHGLRKYLQDTQVAGSKEYVIIPLLGRFKNELGNQSHLTPLVAQTKLGLKVKQWVEARALEGRTRGGAFTERDGSVRYTWYEREILDRFQTIQQRHPDLIPADVQVSEEYSLSRSFRQGATSEARARGTNAADIDVANRWRAFEEAKGHRPRLAMRDHYADIRLLIPALLRFSDNL